MERYIADTASEQARRGWQVTVVGGAPDRMRSELAAGVQVRPARTTTDVVRQLRGISGADVLHGHMTAAELPAVLFKKRLGSRLVVTRHFAKRRGSSVLGRCAAPLIRARIDQQISISEFVAASIGEPSLVILNGTARRSLTRGSERTDSVLVMQRLETEKDTATAVRAFARSHLPELGWQLDVCGRGSEEGDLRHLVSSLEIGQSVRFHGFVNDVYERLSRASLFLATAPAEPFGLAVVEAMAVGTPVIATSSGAHPETLGEAGAFFPPGDVDAAAEQLTGLGTDVARRQTLGAQLRKRQRAMLSIEHHVDQLDAVYAGRSKATAT
ncbi:glycosyltransferase family 4 protein [Humibacter sp.]|uniref:glycosyltransferase family 4 protein n=1 Tax=Humibacter sp. TaxID=1940291 RepID=UPI002C407CFF|nr:glycosyltransferase family 4 protein [Humibacter sp.]HVX07911.1 glycosyltransferase family 4 protein [Humibacter sp.]